MPSIINSDDGVVSGTSGLKTTGGNDGVLNIQTNGANAISISSGQRSTFPTTIGVGGATPSTSGAGITFPATQSASSDANTLDDYEEGTWTPSLNFSGSSTGITYAGGREGRYVKIGKLVTVAFYFKLTSKGSASGNANISGLPFAAYNQLGSYPFYVGTLVGESGMSNMPTGTYCLGWSDSSLYLRSNSSTTWNPLTSASNFNNDSTLYGTITYEVA